MDEKQEEATRIIEAIGTTTLCYVPDINLGCRICESDVKTTELKQIIKNIKEMNPYPSDVFLEPSDEDWKNIGKFLAKHGKNPDRIFAKWGRMVWENCVNCMEDYLPS